MSGSFVLAGGQVSPANAWREKGYRDGAAGRAVSPLVGQLEPELAAAYRVGYRHGGRARGRR